MNHSDLFFSAVLNRRGLRETDRLRIGDTFGAYTPAWTLHNDKGSKADRYRKRIRCLNCKLFIRQADVVMFVSSDTISRSISIPFETSPELHIPTRHSTEWSPEQQLPIPSALSKTLAPR